MTNIKNKLYLYKEGIYTFEKVNELIENDTKVWLEKANEHKDKFDQIRQDEEKKAEDVELDALARKNIEIIETQKLITDLTFAAMDSKHKNDKREQFPEVVEYINNSAKTWDEILTREEDIIDSLTKSPCEPQTKLAIVEFGQMINTRFNNTVLSSVNELVAARENENNLNEENDLV